MVAKQSVFKQSMNHWRKKEEIKKVTRDKWKWKHSGPKPMLCRKMILRGKFIAIYSYFRKQGKSQIKNLTLTTRERRTNKT